MNSSLLRDLQILHTQPEINYNTTNTSYKQKNNYAPVWQST